ncbi:hypothetical protein BDZ91DRAFT_734784 [Kalaharituber pfeilii]|nr:hypothetical protein BDZ91DRAFT_734784 [Kalaharituber pfeilii]
MSNKFYCLTSKVLDRIFTGSNSLEFPFDISKEETKIIKHSNSAAFIQGRSGTGKTTCLLFKLLCRNISSRENEGSPVRQIFVTRSSFLAERLSQYLRRLMVSQLGNFSIPEKPEVASSSLEFATTLKEAEDPLEELSLDNIDDDKFPIVCTFEQLFHFLERVIKFNERNDFSALFEHKNSIAGGRVSKVVDYEIFSTQYWKKHSYDTKKGFEPEIAFAEFIGTIKGSTSAQRGFRPLSRDEYVNGRSPVFTDHASRDIIYDMYQAYERKKRILGDRDDIDRVTKLLKSLEEDQDLKTRVQSLFDEVYVDELQDNKLLELDLILMLVRNPNGIHFAGDTAQCISRDNTFRFQDIKARFYEHFIAMAEEARKRSWARPELFQLAKNYRSHQGILSLAAEIVDMLCNGFPGQIDPLPREVGSYPGTKPTVFVGFDHEILAEGGAAILGTEEGLSCFGAEQVIIVRDDAAKEELQELLGTTLILTIFQSKGLEFDDVVLYNFFTNSMWRNVSVRVLKLLLTKNSASGLDTQKYGMLCSELKHLYVAVTRARKNLWLVESDPASVHSILTLWMRREEDAAGDPLVSIVDVNDPEAQNKVQKIIKPARSTNPKAWEKQGEEFLHRNLYKEALICFRRARNTTGQSVATAYLKYQEARAKDVDVKEVQREARVLYEEAANLFLKANFIQKAAEAWAATRQYRKAADVLRNHGMHGRAGLLYEEARDFRQAAICYDTAKQYDNAVTAYRKGEYFTELIDYLTKNVDRISKSLRTRYSTLINILLQRGDLVLPEASLSAAVETLGDDQEKEDFYKKFNRTGDLWNFYMQKTRYHKAFKLALREGKFEDAVGLSQGQGLRPATAGVDSVIPEYEMLTLFNGLMAEHAWLSMGIRFNGISRSKATSSGAANPISNILRKSTPPVLRGARLGWEQITDCIDDAGTGLTLTRPLENRSSANFFQEFGNDFLDLVELVRLDKNHGHLAQVKDFAEVPIAALSKIATISGDMLGNKPPPTSLLTCVGALLLAPDLDADPSKEVIVFSWSPLLPSTVQGNSSATLQRQHVFMNTQQVFVSFKSWLMRLVTRIIPIALKQLHAVVNGRKDPCFRFLQSGLCRNQIHEETFRHTRSSSEEARGYTLALLEVAGLACATNRLYYNRTLGESESKAFQGTKRAFLERLLKELTFISPFLNDVTVQHQTWDMILAEDGQWLHVRDGMASLFFFRLQTFEWEKRTTLSAVLEESGLAIKLGAMWRFEKFLKRNRATRDLGTTVALLKDFERLQPNNVSKFSCDELSHCAFRWTTFITDLDFYELQAFHAVLSFFELISLELLNRATRLDFLVPRSRLHFVRRDLSGTPALNEKERCDIENVLIEVLQRLCEILSYFAQEYHQRLAQLKLARQTDDEIDPTAHPEALFEVCGYPLRRGNTYMIRRALDHLALCMVNLGVGRIAPIGYQNVLWKAIVQAYTQWKDILRHPTMVDWSSPPLPENIAVQLVNAYKRYNKDELVILEGSSYRAIVKPTSRYQFLIAQGIKVLPKEQPIVRKSKAPAAVSKRKKELDNSEEAIQATKIARWWKRCSVILRSRRENAAQRAQKIASGPQGEAEVAIHDLIAPAMRPRFWHQGRILENSGVAFFRGVLELGTLINTTHAVAMEALTSSRGKYKLSSQFVEHTQQTIGLLEKRKTYLEKQKTFFRNEKEGQALLEMPLDKLQEKMDTALETLEKYTKEVHRWKTEIEGGLKQGKASSVTKPYI